MHESSIARRYAKALIDIAVESGRLDAFMTDLESFHEAEKALPHLMGVLADRFLNLSSRLTVVDQVSSQMGLDPVVGNFLKLLVKKGRISLYRFVLSAYRRYVFELQNKTEAELASAIPVAPFLAEETRKILAKAVGKEIILKTCVQPSLLGGLKLRVGNDVYDGTVRAELERISEKMIRSSF